MTNSTRSFQIINAQRERCPLIIGIVGPSGSGKTYSALELGTGIAEAFNGPLYFVDTEARRALHYADRFAFKHIDFQPPFGPLDYVAAWEAAIADGAKVIITDSLTHEHSGEGGVLWQSEEQLDRWCGDDEGARNRNLARSFIKPKRERRRMINAMIQMSAHAAFICCYRANEKLDFKRKDKNNQPREMGYQPETTSPLMYEMTQQFLLRPGCDGVPELRPSIPDEKMIVKSPSQFRGWFTDGQPLSREIGRRFAEWAMGDQATTKGDVAVYEFLHRLLKGSTDYAALQAAWKQVAKDKASLSDEQFVRLEAIKNELKEVMTNA